MLLAERPRPDALTAVPTADEARLREHVHQLAVPRHRIANRRGNARVRDRLARAFESVGLTVHLQGELENVVALPAHRPSPLVFVGAHYDTVPDCPGADDNASGLAGLLECARLLRGQDVGFVAFNGEEDGLLGSADFVRHGLEALGRSVRAIHVLEMIGYRASVAEAAKLPRLPFPILTGSLATPDFLALLGNGHSNRLAELALDSAAAPDLRVVTAKTWGPIHRLLTDLGRSDHLPFWQGKIPALLWTDTGNFRNPRYHRPSDTAATLDYGFLQSVTELLVAVVRQTACAKRGEESGDG